MNISYLVGNRIKNKKLTDVSIKVLDAKLVKYKRHSDEFDEMIQLDVVWMNDLYEMEIGPDTLYIQPETLSDWYIYESIKQTSE